MINETSIIEIKKSINWLFIQTTSLSYMLLSREMTFKSLCRGVFNFDLNMNNTFLKKSYDISNTALIMALQTIFTTNSPIFIHFGCFRWLAGLWSLSLPLSFGALMLCVVSVSSLIISSPGCLIFSTRGSAS